MLWKFNSVGLSDAFRKSQDKTVFMQLVLIFNFVAELVSAVKLFRKWSVRSISDPVGGNFSSNWKFFTWCYVSWSLNTASRVNSVQHLIEYRAALLWGENKSWCTQKSPRKSPQINTNVFLFKCSSKSFTTDEVYVILLVSQIMFSTNTIMLLLFVYLADVFIGGRSCWRFESGIAMRNKEQ